MPSRHDAQGRPGCNVILVLNGRMAHAVGFPGPACASVLWLAVSEYSRKRGYLWRLVGDYWEAYRQGM
jgi:hypothetical protein